MMLELMIGTAAIKEYTSSVQRYDQDERRLFYLRLPDVAEKLWE